MAQQPLRPTILITCEHGGHKVPLAWRHLFAGRQETLQSHRGWDPGALALARQFAARMEATLFSSLVTRLLVELNRSLHHPGLFSEFTRDLSRHDRQQLLESWWHPYRRSVTDRIVAETRQGHCVVHISVHSFTPEWRGEERTTDIGILFDPARPRERSLCRAWQRGLRTEMPQLKVHRNSPYRGATDGFTTALRRQFGVDEYIGVEVEVNQKHLVRRSSVKGLLSRVLPEQLHQAVSTGLQ